MILRIVAVSGRSPAWIDAGYDEYAKRFSQDFKLEYQNLRLAARRDVVALARKDEGERLLEKVRGLPFWVSLDERGIELNTTELAARLKQWQGEHREVAFLIGGPDGLSDEVRQLAPFQWSLSRLTLPHGLVRVLVAEQLYRAISLLQGHPYHRA